MLHVAMKATFLYVQCEMKLLVLVLLASLDLKVDQIRVLGYFWNSVTTTRVLCIFVILQVTPRKLEATYFNRVHTFSDLQC